MLRQPNVHVGTWQAQRFQYLVRPVIGVSYYQCKPLTAQQSCQHVVQQVQAFEETDSGC